MYSEPYRRRTELLEVELTLRDSDYLFTVARLKNAPEILYRLAAVMFAHDFSIEEAEINTHEDGLVRDRFRIRPLVPEVRFTDLKFEKMMGDFERLLFESYSVLDYLEESQHRPQRPERYATQVEFEHAELAKVRIRTADRPGALLSMLQVFALMEVNILQARIRLGDDGRTDDEFVLNPGDSRLGEERFAEHLRDAMRLMV